ncbi:nitroreductase family protein [Micromonospora zhanjiangensis]|uniref:Nitroreductase family protein n=1 Tax=Micromonospora zhanjiangensis TaxID=1522057 RepID=A0ABV8KUT2_9ACTN
MPELHPLLADRWSPRAFDPTATVTDDELASLLEAARWAPSAGDSQPWRFVAGRRDHETYKRILANLADGDQRWADRASALLVGAHLTATRSGARMPYAAYDLGQSVAHLSVQAGTLGWYVRQVTEFDRAGLRDDLDLPARVEPRVVIAVGRPGDPRSLPPDLLRREIQLRRRQPLADLLLR